MHSKVFGKETRKGNSRAGVGVEPQRGKRLLRQQAAAGGNAEQPEIRSCTGQRFVRCL